MGTRADFYVGRGKDAEWLGSIAWDGYPNALNCVDAQNLEEFKLFVSALGVREDFTWPKDGWPWPWKTSAGTDYAYAWDEGVHICAYGCGWMTPKEWAENQIAKVEKAYPKITDFPDMGARQNVTLGPRSGIILLR